METVPAKTLLTRTKDSKWFGCEFNMNIYRGCCHGCLYCDSRSDCYHVDRFDTVRAKENAMEILRNELSRKAMPFVVATGAMSDPYNPFEKKEELTRKALMLLDAYGFGVAIATKSDLICRDADILKDISAHSPVICKITITCADDTLAKKLEPAAPLPSARFAAIEALAAQGIFCGVLLMPVLPFIEDNDENILEIVERTAKAGGRFIYPSFGVTMRAGQREYFLNGLEKAFPQEGYRKIYTERYGDKYFCSSPRARHLWDIFTKACQSHGLLYQMPEIIRAYKQGRQTGQLSFL